VENGRFRRIEFEKRRGVLIRARQKLQEESDSAWYAKILAIVHPDLYPDIKLTNADYEELFYPDTDDEESECGDENPGLSYRYRLNAALTGLKNDKSVRPARAFLSMTHATTHPKLKPKPVITLTPSQEAAYMKAAEAIGGIASTEPPKVAPKLSYSIAKYIRPLEGLPPPPCPPGWLEPFRREAELRARAVQASCSSNGHSNAAVNPARLRPRIASHTTSTT